VADEATSALDVTTRAQILDLLARLQRERGMALLLISHDLGLVAARADTVAVMYAGRIVEHGAAAEVFTRPRMPYTAALLSSRPSLDGPSHQRLAAPAGHPPPVGSPPPGCAFAPRCPFAGPECTASVPPLAGNGHRVACVRPLDGRPR
jgi:peptide/nickel transport system ATP-binding protein